MNFANRRCTDALCLVIFLGTIGAMCFFSFYGFAFGDINKVMDGLDGAGNICGVGNYSEYGFVYIS